ncbi:unnamed protein product [Orchesella dallaii]|uniref:Uncharacterized protein n=1 Tax=Orchesella dallaii TaxID=48710 RepID=A0ABP1PSL5_9HEXA
MGDLLLGDCLKVDQRSTSQNWKKFYHHLQKHCSPPGVVIYVPTQHALNVTIVTHEKDVPQHELADLEWFTRLRYGESFLQRVPNEIVDTRGSILIMQDLMFKLVTCVRIQSLSQELDYVFVSVIHCSTWLALGTVLAAYVMIYKSLSRGIDIMWPLFSQPCHCNHPRNIVCLLWISMVFVSCIYASNISLESLILSDFPPLATLFKKGYKIWVPDRQRFFKLAGKYEKEIILDFFSTLMGKNTIGAGDYDVRFEKLYEFGYDGNGSFIHNMPQTNMPKLIEDLTTLQLFTFSPMVVRSLGKAAATKGLVYFRDDQLCKIFHSYRVNVKMTLRMWSYLSDKGSYIINTFLEVGIPTKFEKLQIDLQQQNNLKVTETGACLPPEPLKLRSAVGQAGSLKKRNRRNLNKVSGLSFIQYNESEDLFDGTAVFTSGKSNYVRKEHASNLRISAFLQESNCSSSTTRITRDPTFHIDVEDTDVIKDYMDYDSERAPYSDAGGVKNRQYFLDKLTIRRLRQILFLGLLSGAFPWIWNSKKHRIDRWTRGWEKAWKIQWLILFIHTCVLTLYQGKLVIESIPKGPKATYRKFFMGFVSLFWYFFATIFNINIIVYQDSIRSYINTLFRFNFEFMKKYVVDLDGYPDGGRSVMNLSIPSNIFQVFVSVLSFLAMPFQPWFLFSYIYPKPWYWLIPGAIQDFVVVGQVITSYTLYQWVIVAHTNSMEFWLRESHRNYDSSYTIDELRHPKTAVETYRILKIVCARFNDCMSPLSFPMMKLPIVLAMIPCGVVFIRSLNHFFIDEFPAILTYPIGILDCATAGFCTLSMAANVYDLASGFVNSWNQTRHQNFRRILISCPTLKLKVAQFYFVTVGTTITFFKAVTEYIIDCIITFP